MERVPMDLDEAKTLARAGNVGRTSLALFAELEKVEATVDLLRASIVQAEREGTDEIRELRARAEKAEAAIARVRTIHSPDEYGVCLECDLHMPCPTVAALDQED